MEEELKLLLRKNLELSEENHKILLGMRRAGRWGTFFRLIYWFVILGGLAVSYYYIQPYLSTVLGAYEQIQTNLSEIQNQKNSLPDLSKLLENLRQ